MVKMINSIKTLSKFVLFSMAMIILYTIAELTISTRTGQHHDQLTTCVFMFFGTEIAMSGFLKIFKIREEREQC